MRLKTKYVFGFVNLIILGSYMLIVGNSAYIDSYLHPFWICHNLQLCLDSINLYHIISESVSSDGQVVLQTEMLQFLIVRQSQTEISSCSKYKFHKVLYKLFREIRSLSEGIRMKYRYLRMPSSHFSQQNVCIQLQQ